MNKGILLRAFLLMGMAYAEGNVLSLVHDSKYVSLPAKELHDPNTNTRHYIETRKSNSIYQHNKPSVIDDPLPIKVDCLKPLYIDFKIEPSFKGAFLTGLFFNVYEKHLFKENPAQATITNFKIVDATGINQEINKTKPSDKNTLDHDIKAESSIQINNYIKKPVEIDVVPINYFVGPATKYKLFNHDDDYELSGSAPEVIFKPGDDIAFLKDTSVIDDYEHNITEKEYNKTKKSNTKPEISKSFKNTSVKPLIKKSLEKNKNENVTAAASTSYSKTSLDSYPSAATEHLVTYEKSESSTMGSGYVYDKPKIPFTF